MDVVIRGIILKEEVEYITGEPEAAVIVDSLHDSKTEEEYSCPSRHSWHKERDNTAEGVQKKTLQRVVVEGANRVRDDQPVVLGVDVAV